MFLLLSYFVWHLAFLKGRFHNNYIFTIYGGFILNNKQKKALYWNTAE